MSFVSLKRAAEIAGKSSRTIRNWVDRYGISKTYLNRIPHIDLQELQVTMDSFGEKALSGPLLSLLLRRLELLQREVDLLKYLHGLDVPKDYHGEDAVLVFTLAQQYSLAQPQDDEQAELYLNLVSEISEATLESVAAVTGENHPWIPFWYASHSLRLWLQSELHSSRRARRSRLLSMRTRLTAARERLRALALFFIEMDTSSSTREELHTILGAEEFCRRVDRVLAEAIKGNPEWTPPSNDPLQILQDVVRDLRNGRDAPGTLARKLRRAASLLENEKNRTSLE